MAEIGMTHWAASCLVPGSTFHGIRTASWVSKSKNSAMEMVMDRKWVVRCVWEEQ